ncbi:hypothetical protein POM88_034119 [Heracleum sosnowskyi]|uniref:Uncharacterized protein n=1 Tax=Heracleum sosnowskyi TaxID=360622 RepID=A0AAD8MCP6_9APIA|nr:hypothetical protein POM88_034119 [Heracleum sosnowskyi]
MMTGFLVLQKLRSLTEHIVNFLLEWVCVDKELRTTEDTFNFEVFSVHNIGDGIMLDFLPVFQIYFTSSEDIAVDDDYKFSKDDRIIEYHAHLKFWIQLKIFLLTKFMMRISSLNHLIHQKDGNGIYDEDDRISSIDNYGLISPGLQALGKGFSWSKNLVHEECDFVPKETRVVDFKRKSEKNKYLDEMISEVSAGTTMGRTLKTKLITFEGWNQCRSCITQCRKWSTDIVIVFMTDVDSTMIQPLKNLLDKIALGELHNGAILSVDIRQRPDSHARLTGPRILLHSKSSSQDTKKSRFELRGSIYSSGTTSTSSSISCLTSLKQYDQYF